MKPDSDLLDHLLHRHSTPAKYLASPAPDEATLQRILQAAESAPDHGGLHPWRFLVIEGQGLERLGEVFVEAMQRRDPAATEATLERERERALRPPLIVAAIARRQPGHAKIPEIEQLLAAGIATHQVMLATEALGFGVVWLTGLRVYDDYVMQALGLAADETLIGLINIGTPTESAPTKGKKRRRAEVERWGD